MLLPYASPQKVREMVKDTIYTFRKGGGYIVDPSWEITKDVLVENVKALVLAIVIERERVLIQ